MSIDAVVDYYKMILKKPDKRKKLNYIIDSLYANNVNKANYEEYKDYPNTAAFKLGRGAENIRIYCKVEKLTSKNGDLTKKLVF